MLKNELLWKKNIMNFADNFGERRTLDEISLQE